MYILTPIKMDNSQDDVVESISEVINRNVSDLKKTISIKMDDSFTNAK